MDLLSEKIGGREISTDIIWENDMKWNKKRGKMYQKKEKEER